MRLEVIFVWENGKEEVRYIREPHNGEEAKKLIEEVEALQKRLGADCPYFYRIT